MLGILTETLVAAKTVMESRSMEDPAGGVESPERTRVCCPGTRLS